MLWERSLPYFWTARNGQDEDYCGGWYVPVPAITLCLE
jgi:hypothetical protein